MHDGGRPVRLRRLSTVRYAAGKRCRLPSASAPGNAAQDGGPARRRHEDRAATVAATNGSDLTAEQLSQDGLETLERGIG